MKNHRQKTKPTTKKSKPSARTIRSSSSRSSVKSQADSKRKRSRGAKQKRCGCARKERTTTRSAERQVVSSLEMVKQTLSSLTSRPMPRRLLRPPKIWPKKTPRVVRLLALSLLLRRYRPPAWLIPKSWRWLVPPAIRMMEEFKRRRYAFHPERDPFLQA